jgi:dephospho-CoA kinase
MSSRALRVVIGGGIGSGKTTVARMMERLGATVILADEVGHRVLEPDGEAYQAVAAAWPQVVVSGMIDRRALAAIVFADREELRRLEAITHPAISERIRRLASGIDGDLVLETPVPDVATGEGWVRVYVDVAPEVRLRRTIARGGDPDDVRRRMASQLERGEWLRWAERVIVNGGSLDDLEAQVDDLFHSLRAGEPA